MKRILATILSSAIVAPMLFAAGNVDGTNATEQVGIVTYSLPSTSLSFKVKALRETFHAGPYSEYAEKYLGIKVRKADAVNYTLTEVSMVPMMEADQTARYSIQLPGPAAQATFLKMTSCGLICVNEYSTGDENSWRFPVDANGNFASMAVNMNYSSKEAALHRTGNGSYDNVPVMQNMMVQKSLEKRAAETAKLIFELREKRLQIITGDTDATYSGEAMGAAVAELTRLEKEYMTMFIGFSEYQTQELDFELVPDKTRSNQMYVAFRLSESLGLLPADNLSGKPVVLEIIPEGISQPQNGTMGAKPDKNMLYATYRIPAICLIRLTNGSETILQTRIPIWQFGKDSTLPVQRIK